MKTSLHKHNWNVSPKEAIEIQKDLKEKVRLLPLKHRPRLIAGADVSLNMFSKDLYAGVIVLTYPALEVVEYALAKTETTFPYVPGLLSFREIPGLMECISKLSTMPDVYMIDGQGIAHPRRLGIASHLGVLIERPAIGCAKSVLYGKLKRPDTPGATEPITDPRTGEVLGFALLSKVRSNPLIISPGHLITPEDSLDIVQHTLQGYRLPEPTRLAHELVNKFRRGELSEN